MLIKSIILSLIGLTLSLYAYSIEQKIKNNHAYAAACDLNDYVSCSKPIISGYGSLFGITNSVAGMIFYVGILLLALLGMHTYLFWAAVAACCASVVFAFILFFKVQALCLICISIYAINGLLLWVNW
ncbi:MAG: hypothetical protein NT124_04175 [Candidatus Dependentiae bacterium]|nr:hypothetical protein [Candidatus Dependentiae bacterium]